jgi:MoxR-like ATPase
MWSPAAETDRWESSMRVAQREQAGFSSRHGLLSSAELTQTPHTQEPSMSQDAAPPVSTDAIDLLHNARTALQSQIHKLIVGQDEVIEQLLIALFSQGHVLLEGVPGLAKTLMISTLAKSLSMTFSRIQFTPDLMPADITGTDVLQENRSTGLREFRFIPGPLFHNVVLADEINRTPPKTQAALLEAMQERQVTVGQTIHQLSAPFFVLATQNPIEQEGTYTLPEAQQDRFMFKVFVRYPSFDEERQIARQTTSSQKITIEPVLSGEQVLELQTTVRQVPVSDHIINYTLALVRQTRVGEVGTPDWINQWLGWGAGPRAVQNLLLGAKTRALLLGRTHVAIEDIQTLAAPVLRHRIVPNFTAESEGITSDKVVERLIKETPCNESDLTSDPRLGKIFAA